MLRLDLCNFSDAYIVVKGDIILEGDNDDNKRNKNFTFKNNAPFISCISKINGIKIDNVEDLNVVMPMYNLIVYSKNYRKTTGSLWNYYRDQPSDPLSTNSESFKYKTSIVGKTTQENDSLTNVEVVIPLKYFSNFWRNLDIPLINCEVEIILTWSKNCVLADMTVDATLSKENNIKLLKKLKSGFKKTIKWNKYRSQMTIQNNNNNLKYLTDPTYTNVSRLFVL